MGNCNSNRVTPLKRADQHPSIPIGIKHRDYFEFGYLDLSVNKPHHLFSQLFLELLLRLPLTKSDLDEFFHRHHNHYNDSALTQQVRSEYNKSGPVALYTKDPFIYENLNRAFRRHDYHELFNYRRLIQDLHKQLQKWQLHNQEFITVYRGQAILADDLRSLKEARDQCIYLPTFLSASRDYDVALNFARASSMEVDGNRALYKIVIKPSNYYSNRKPFAPVSHLSRHDELEVLFMAGTMFHQCGAPVYDEDKHLYIIHLELDKDKCTNYELNSLLQFKMTDMPQSSDLLAIINLFCTMGRLTEAEFFIQLVKSDLLPSDIYRFAELSFISRNFEAAFDEYQRVLAHQYRTNVNDVMKLGKTYKRLADISFELKRYKQALSFARRAHTAINSREKCSDTALVATILVFIGRTQRHLLIFRDSLVLAGDMIEEFILYGQIYRDVCYSARSFILPLK